MMELKIQADLSIAHLDALHHSQWAPRAIAADGKTKEVYLRLEFFKGST